MDAYSKPPSLSEPLEHALDRVGGAWGEVIARWRSSAEARRLISYVDARVAEGVAIYPVEVFRALALTPLERTRVVIVGQDPYHGAGQAEGLAFSVAPGVRVPPSLRNIFKELERDLGLARPSSGSLEQWAQQGVLLLNTSLTVEDGAAASHSKRGWESLTDALIGAAAGASESLPKVFMLWGSHAQAKRPLIEERVAAVQGQALVLASNHPSPLSATRQPVPFIGCGHFSRANEFLGLKAGPEGVINWRLR